jgi:myosin-5
LLQRTLKDENKYQVGLSKIFFRAGMVALLESLRTARLNALVTLVQKNVRRRIAYKHYQDLRRRTIVIQAWWRGVLGRRIAEEMRKAAAAILIQRAARAFLQRRSFLQTRQAVISIQSGTYRRLCLLLTFRSRSWLYLPSTFLGGANSVCGYFAPKCLPRIVS